MAASDFLVAAKSSPEFSSSAARDFFCFGMIRKKRRHQATIATKIAMWN